MNVHTLFGISALMSLVASSVFAKLYVWPRLRIMDRDDALVPLVAPHMFLRFSMSTSCDYRQPSSGLSHLWKRTTC